MSSKLKTKCFKPVTKQISFIDLFPPESGRELRIKRWKECQKTCEDEPEQAERWATDAGCLKCDQYCEKDDWCELANLPPSVNPILSFGYGMIGLACCGTYINKPETV
jgi:hypothetical protein